MKRKGFTLIELLVVIAIIAMLLAILMPALSKVKKIAQRVVCGTNLKGLGTAQTVYANDYDDQYAVQNIETWAHATGNFDEAGGTKTFPAPIGTVGASLYLLVREADVSPKSFVCGAGGQTAYEGQNSTGRDIVDLWDFGIWSTAATKTPDDGIGSSHGPKNHVSYSYQMPYGPNGGRGRYAADATRGASFAVMADKNPWFDPKLGLPPVTANDWADKIGGLGPYYRDNAVQRWEIEKANAYPHGREGQNVLFADGHSSYEKTADVGVKHDNIYTVRNTSGSGEDVQRVGRAVYAIDNASQPEGSDDSYLVNDDARGAPYE
jgi:prepilin-type N-terminal cleavage/methylation domain-containing protein/prepilin-type processing-associated H-X9-DG protein